MRIIRSGPVAASAAAVLSTAALLVAAPAVAAEENTANVEVSALRAAPPSRTLAFDTWAVTRCAAGKVVIVVTVRNNESFPVTFTTRTPAGTRADTVVDAGKSTSSAHSVRRASVDAGSIDAVGKARVDGISRITTQTVEFDAASCS